MQILIVDDDKSMLTALSGEVERLGYRPLTADSTDSALEVLLNNEVDILLTDLRMSGRDGIDLIKLAKGASPRTRAILMSAYATARDYKTAVEQGAVDVLTKPFTPEDLTEAINKAAECDEGFAGSVHGLGLTDILQMFHYAKRSLVIRIDTDKAIYLRDGEIVHAVAGEQAGVDALREVLMARSGSVRTSAAEPSPTTIDEPLDGLLLEMMRQIDEAGAAGSSPAPAGDSSPAPASQPPGASGQGQRPEAGPSSQLDGAPHASSVTWGGTTDDTPGRPPPPSPSAPEAGSGGKRWLLMVAAVVLIGVSGITVLVFFRSPPSDPAAEATATAGRTADAQVINRRLGSNRLSPPPPVRPAEPNGHKRRRVTVHTRPSGTVLVDAETKEALGETPLTLELAEDTRREVRARVDGQLTDPFIITASSDTVTLDLPTGHRPRGSYRPRGAPKPRAQQRGHRLGRAPTRAASAPPTSEDRSAGAAGGGKGPPDQGRTTAPPTIGTVDDKKPTIGTVDDESPKIGIIGEEKPKIGIIAD